MSETVICRSSVNIDPMTVKRFRWDNEEFDQEGNRSVVWSCGGQGANSPWGEGAAEILEWMPGYGADRATGKAAPMAQRRLADGWRTSDSICCFSPECGSESQRGYFSSKDCRGSCATHAPAMGVFADSPVTNAKPATVAPVPAVGPVKVQWPAPRPEKVAPPWKCIDEKCETPAAPRYVARREALATDQCVVCADSYIATMTGAKGLEPDGPPMPKQPRVRDIYSPEMSEGADPDWVQS